MSEIVYFCVACGFALIANLLFFYMRSRLRTAGYVLPYPFWPRDLRKTLHLYSSESTAKNWSIWPVYFFWISFLGAVAFILVIAVSRWGVSR